MLNRFGPGLEVGVLGQGTPSQQAPAPKTEERSEEHHVPAQNTLAILNPKEAAFGNSKIYQNFYFAYIDTKVSACPLAIPRGIRIGTARIVRYFVVQQGDSAHMHSNRQRFAPTIPQSGARVC